MKNDDEQSSLILTVIGIIPVIWFALLVAPYLSSGLMGILDGVPEAMNHPFSIRLCGDSVKTCLLYTSDAADEEDRVDLGGPRLLKKKKKICKK